MDLLDLFWDLHQQRRLADHDDAIGAVAGRVDHQGDELTRLRSEHARLTLTCHALVRLLIDRGLVTQAELDAAVSATAAELEQVTGRRLCSGCGRLAKPVAGRCMYCGTAVPRPPSA